MSAQVAILLALLLNQAPAGEGVAQSPQVASAPAIVPPKLQRERPPRRPKGAEAASGEVRFQLLIGRDGRVLESTLESATVPKGLGLEAAAAEAAQSLQFAPATQAGQPIPVVVGYTVRFAPPQVELDGAAKAEAKPGPEPEPLVATVEGSRDFTAASARTVRDRDLMLRPISAPEDILRVVPGLVLAQHQGGGKADQLFLRGFDADHGTDVAVSLDGIGLNLPSHAHGQGYTDLHFIIPEAIERVDVTKGPYFADRGDFDTAGAIDLQTRDAFEKSEIKVMGGLMPTVLTRPPGTAGPLRGGSARVLGVAASNHGSTHSWFAGEVATAEGPFLRSEDLHRVNLFAKTTTDLGSHLRLSALATAYSSGWVGSGQIPARLVDAGFLDRFGAIDPTEGGQTSREQLILSLRARPDARTQLTAQVSALRYSLTLFNDFTFQARDAVHGDEAEQDDRRVSLAASLRLDRRQELGHLGHLTHSFGAQVRSDDLTASLAQAQKRARLATCFAPTNPNPCIDTATRESDLSIYAQEDLKPLRWARLVLGLRSDLFSFDVHSLRAGGGLSADSPDPVVPVRQRTQLSPKASLVLSPAEQVDLFVNYGRGFHSNDARGVVQSGGEGALAQAQGYEVGARARLLAGDLSLGAALWRLDLSSELSWSGDAGGTVPSGATRRQGIELEGRWDPLPWLYADLDVSLTHGQFKEDAGNGSAIAAAPPRIITGGLTAHRSDGWSATLRARHVGPRPGTRISQDDPLDPRDPGGPRVPPCSASALPDARCALRAEGYLVLDASIGYDAGPWALQLFGQNLANSAFREAQFANVSQVIDPPGGTTVSRSGAAWVPEMHPVQDIHFTPGNPLELQLAATLRF